MQDRLRLRPRRAALGGECPELKGRRDHRVAWSHGDQWTRACLRTGFSSSASLEASGGHDPEVQFHARGRRVRTAQKQGRGRLATPPPATTSRPSRPREWFPRSLSAQRQPQPFDTCRLPNRNAPCNKNTEIKLWSPRWDSNPRPAFRQRAALCTKLRGRHPHVITGYCPVRTFVKFLSI